MKTKKTFMDKTCNFTKVTVQKAKVLFELAQLKLRLSQLKTKIEDKYALLGSKIFWAKKNNQDVNLEEKSISAILESIDGLMKKLEATKKEIKECKHCISSIKEQCDEDGERKENDRCDCKNTNCINCMDEDGGNEDFVVESGEEK